jgi:5-(carboxyamino)imidazole ribonucleotide synthase
MVGAGQLARMSCQAAISLGIGFRVLAGSARDSAAQICADVQVGDYTRLEDLLAFAGGCDVVTFDHEHVPGQHLTELERAVAVRPGAAALRHTQDKLAMRERLTALGVPCPRYAPVSDLAGVTAFAARCGWPVVLKAVSGGYDGRGVWMCETPDEAAESVVRVAVSNMYAEFTKILSRAAVDPRDVLRRHRVVFRKSFTLDKDGKIKAAKTPPLPSAQLREEKQRVFADWLWCKFWIDT